MDYLTVEEGRQAQGLRLVLVAGTPGVWGEAIKAVYHVKGIDYKPVAQLMGQPNEALLDWTGQSSAPVAVNNNERVRVSWENMLWQAEQLAPQPRLIPQDARQRVAMFGLLREFAGECGLAWDRRLQSIAAVGGPDVAPELGRLAYKYGYSEDELQASMQRVSQNLALFSDVLEEQRDLGSRYYVGDSLSAVDLYSAIMVGVMVDPMPPESIPMPEGMRFGFSQRTPCLDSARPVLFEHRDYIFDTYLQTPLDF